MGMIVGTTGFRQRSTCPAAAAKTTLTCRSPTTRAPTGPPTPPYTGPRAAPNATNLGNGTCAWGPDGQLIAKVDLSLSTPTTFTVPSTRTDCASGTTCTLAEERQNFANWFQYYRKLHLMLNAALGMPSMAYTACAPVPSCSTTWSSPAVNMFDFDASTGTAPSIVADPTKVYRSLGAAGADHWRRRHAYAPVPGLGLHPVQADEYGAPMTNYCQFDAAFVITDGFASTTYDSRTGNTALPTNYGNYDGQTPDQHGLPIQRQYLPGGDQPGSHAHLWDNVSITLADIAMKMYTENQDGFDADRAVCRWTSPTCRRALIATRTCTSTHTDDPRLERTIFAATSTDPTTQTTLTNQNNNRTPTIPVGTPWAMSPASAARLRPSTNSGIDHQRAWTDAARQFAGTDPRRGADHRSQRPKGGAAAAVAVSNPNPVAGDNFAYASNYNSGAWSGDINFFRST